MIPTNRIDIHITQEIGYEEKDKWKTIVFVTCTNIWSIIITVQVYMTIIFCTYRVSFSKDYAPLIGFMYISDLFYLFDFICTLVYCNSQRIRKLIIEPPRHWIFLFLDFMSLLPLELSYQAHFISSDRDNFISRVLIQNRCLRIYRLTYFAKTYHDTVRKGMEYTLLIFLTFSGRILLGGHVLACIWHNIATSTPCTGDGDYCLLWYETNTILILIHNWAGPPEMIQSTYEKLWSVVAILGGLIFIYGHCYPFVMHVFMKVYRTRGKYYQNGIVLKSFLRNMVTNPSLKEKVVKFYSHLWSTDLSDSALEQLIENLPLAMRKEIFTDIYWEALRHSQIFRDTSRNFKRAISITMKSRFVQADEVIYRKGQDKRKMIYLVQGIVQIMADENENSPVLSFSSGTVFGETSLFIQTKSRAIVKCKTLCEIQILEMADVARALIDYPKDNTIVFRNLKKRLSLAKMTQWRKFKLCVESTNAFAPAKESSLVRSSEDCVKWLKDQWRAIWETHERHMIIIKATEEGFRIPSWRKRYQIETRVEFISNYLDTLVLSDIFEEKKDAVCLKTEFPWAIEPNAEILKYWNRFICILSIVPSILYPLCTAWFQVFPNDVFVFSVIVTVTYEIDVALKLLTAVKTKHGIITKFRENLLNRMREPTFYLDLIAAIPFQIYIALYRNRDEMPGYEIGLYLHGALLKSHLFIDLRSPLIQSTTLIGLLKNSLICLLFVYWFAEVLQLIAVRCIAPCDSDNWASRFEVKGDCEKELKMSFASVAQALKSSLRISNFDMYPIQEINVIVIFTGKMLSFFFFCFFLGDLYATYTISVSKELKFQKLLERIERFLEGFHVSNFVKNRVLQMIQFQWIYDRGDCIISRRPLITLAPPNLRNEIYSGVFETFRKCRFFEDESDDFIYDVLDKSSLTAMPSGSLLITSGAQCLVTHILHKGYCQLNSFIDVKASLASPILLEPGCMFPLMSTFCHAPVPASVITLTDCEIIITNLEDLLGIMMAHNAFKDIVEVIKENNFTEKISKIEPALIQMDVKYNPSIDQRELYLKPFKKLLCCGFLLRHLLLKKALSLDSKTTMLWEALHTAYLILLCALWPACFGIFMYEAHILIPILTASRIVTLLHFYFQFHIPYFNKTGILITHPLYTAWRYISLTFVTETISNLPVYVVYRYGFRTPGVKDNSTIVIFHIVQKYLVIIIIDGFFRYFESGNRYKFEVRMIKLFTHLFLILNCYINTKMFFGAEFVFDEQDRIVSFRVCEDEWVAKSKLLKDESPFHYYIIVAYWLIADMTMTDVYIAEEIWYEMIISYVNNFIGCVGIFVIYAWMSSSSFISNMNVTMYQDRMKSFIEFLRSEDADDRIADAAIAHFEHEWSRSRAENLRGIFQRLPHHLHEELMYPLYRPTLTKIDFLSNANEGFYKTLSTKLTHVYLNRGSVIIFENEVQSDIYFLHRGKCFVFDWFLMLEVGSMIGDIRRTGVMSNRIHALTHVELLRISSDEFYTVLNIFYETEIAFMNEIKKAENFIKSNYERTGHQLRQVDSRDALQAFGLSAKILSFEDESFFEDPQNATVYVKFAPKSAVKEKVFTFIIYPGSHAMALYNALYLSVAFLTAIIIPLLFFFGALTDFAFAVVASLDILWAIKIIATFRIGVIDKLKGDLITEWKYVAKSYLLRADGIALDLLAVIPFEYGYLATISNRADADEVAIASCRAFRLLRGYFLLRYLRKEVRKLKVHYIVRWISIIMTQLLFINTFVTVYIGIATVPEIAKAKDKTKLGYDQLAALITAYHYVLNIFSSAHLYTVAPDNIIQVVYFNITALFSIIAKGFAISGVLSIIYVNSFARAKYKAQVTQLESYLKVHDLSPFVLKEVLAYKCNLLMACKSENMPVFLTSAPPSLKISIMKDLYVHHLKNCPLFGRLDDNFLDQLAVRLKREIYFPGQKIVEKGDVDNRMYILHKGEINVIEQTEDVAYVEYVVDRVYSGEQFGEAQGLWTSKPHKYTYRARSIVEVLVLESKNWSDLRRSFPEKITFIQETAKRMYYI